jgi:hypothetical protein
MKPAHSSTAQLDRQRRRRPAARFRAAVRRVIGPALAIGVAAGLGVAGWRTCGRYGERCGEAGQFFPVYDLDTGGIRLVMHDLNGNGVIDTWVYRNGIRIEEIELDRDEDGTVDGLMVADEHGVLRPREVAGRRQ